MCKVWMSELTQVRKIERPSIQHGKRELGKCVKKSTQVRSTLETKITFRWKVWACVLVQAIHMLSRITLTGYSRALVGKQSKLGTDNVVIIRRKVHSNILRCDFTRIDRISSSGTSKKKSMDVSYNHLK